MSDYHFWLSGARFDRIRSLLPNKVLGVPGVDDRRVISGIVHVIRDGLGWRDAPAEYGPHKTHHNRFACRFDDAMEARKPGAFANVARDGGETVDSGRSRARLPWTLPAWRNRVLNTRYGPPSIGGTGD